MSYLFSFLSLSLISFTHLYAYTKITDQSPPLLTHDLASQKQLKIRLENGLELLLISDPRAKTSGAALRVEVGSWEDPKELPGTAHFLEHMLFLGTESFPIESDYQRFISHNGGKCNAYTGSGCTAYFFTVKHKAFQEALERFSSFFYIPLFNPSGIERELNIIDQEFAKNFSNDDIRQYYIHKELSDRNHPLSHFSIGNHKTLQNVSREHLIDWYQKHYSANLMKGVLISSLPLDEMSKLAESNFGKIPNYDYKFEPPQVKAFSDDILGRLILIEPLRNQYRLTINWEIPTKFCDMNDCKPAELITFALGHEAEESLLAQLKREGLAEELVSDTVRHGPNLTQISLEIELTREGLDNYREVIARTFQAIARLQEKGIPPLLFEENKQLSILHFQYQPRQDEFTMLRNYMGMLSGETSLENFPAHKMIIQRYHPGAIKELLNSLTPQNALYTLLAPSKLTKISYDRQEQWFGTSYAVLPTDKELLTFWKAQKPHANIDIPPPNQFIPGNLDCRHEVEESEPANFTPISLEKSEHATAYYLADTHYGEPKICSIIEIATPELSYEDASSFVLGDLLLKSVEENLRQLTYKAKLAGLNLSLQRIDNRLTIQIDGYNDKAKKLLEELLQALSEVKLSRDQFKNYKLALQKKYQNFNQENSLLHSIELWHKILFRDFFTEKQLDLASRKISYEQAQNFFKNWRNKTHIYAFFAGNASQEETVELLRMIKAHIQHSPYLPFEQPQRKILHMDSDGPFMLEVKSKAEGNAALLAIELPTCDYHQCAVQRLLMLAIKTPFFDDLRTKQKTAYLVLSQAEEVEGRLFNIFAVQSDTHQPFELLARFELFLETYLQGMGKEYLSAAEFEEIKHTLLHLLAQPPSNLVEATQMLNRLAFKFQGDFSRRKKIIAALNELTYIDFLKEAQVMIGRKNKLRLGLLHQGKTQHSEEFKYKMTNSQQLRKLSHYTPAIL